MDRGYMDFSRLARIAAAGAFFVTGAKNNLRLSRHISCRAKSGQRFSRAFRISLDSAPLPLRFCHHAIREMLFGATARLPSIPHKLLRTPALAEPTASSLGFLADFRPAIHHGCNESLRMTLCNGGVLPVHSFSRFSQGEFDLIRLCPALPAAYVP
jgi:hypothetical protein